MPNLITRIPPRSTICVYNCIGSRQAKMTVNGSRVGEERWAAIIILAQERAYPLKVTIRHPYYSNAAKYADGAMAGVARRSSYQGSFDGGRVTSQPPTKGISIGNHIDGECAMTLTSPEHFAAPSGPRILPAKYPGGVSIVAQEVADPPNGTNDAREEHLCFVCGEQALAFADFCDAHEPTRAHTICTFLNTEGSQPVQCHAAKAEGSEFCPGHSLKPKRGGRPKGSKNKVSRAKPKGRKTTVVTIPDLGVTSG